MKKLPRKTQKLSQFGRETVLTESVAMFEQPKHVAEIFHSAQSTAETKR